MNNARRLSFLATLAAVVAALVLLGALLYLAVGGLSSDKDRAITVKLVEHTEGGVNSHYRWLLVGRQRWVSAQAVYSGGPGNVVNLVPSKSGLDGMFGNASSRIYYDLKLQLVKDSMGSTDRYNELLTMQGDSGPPAMAESNSFPFTAAGTKLLVLAHFDRETTIRAPKYVDLAEVDGQPLRLEFGH